MSLKYEHSLEHCSHSTLALGRACAMQELRLHYLLPLFLTV